MFKCGQRCYLHTCTRGRRDQRVLFLASELASVESAVLIKSIRVARSYSCVFSWAPGSY